MARIVTDAGPGFLKPLGNKEGPHALARELIAIRLARWFDLPTFEYAIMTVHNSDQIPLGHNRHAEPGPAFITKAHKGHPWGGKATEFEKVENRDIVAKLIVFDTLILNSDRYPPTDARKPNYDNVFLTAEDAPSGQFRLLVMDHTHAFRGPDDLTKRIAFVDNVKDENIYGYFPEFRALICRRSLDEAIASLNALDQPVAMSVVYPLPPQWQVPDEAQEALCKFLVQRAQFLPEIVERKLGLENTVQGDIEF